MLGLSNYDSDSDTSDNESPPPKKKPSSNQDITTLSSVEDISKFILNIHI